MVKDVEACSVCREDSSVEVCMYSDQLTLPRKCEEEGVVLRKREREAIRRHGRRVFAAGR